MPKFNEVMGNLDAKIEETEKQEPAKKAITQMPKEKPMKTPKADPKELWGLYDEWEKKAFAEQTPENIEKGNKAADDLYGEFMKHLTPKQQDEFDTVFGTFKHPDEVTEYMEKIIGKRPKEELYFPKTEEKKKPDFYFPREKKKNQDEDEIERFDDEIQYSYDYIYKGLPRKRQIDIFAERMDITPERAKEYFDSLDKRNAEQKKKIKAKKEQEKKTAKANEQKRVLGLVEQLREAKRAKNEELAQSIIDQILNPDNLPF